jgi:hypothetical protein
LCVCVCVCVFVFFLFFFFGAGKARKDGKVRMNRWGAELPPGDAIGRMGGRRNEMVKTDLRSTLDRRW